MPGDNLSVQRWTATNCLSACRQLAGSLSVSVYFSSFTGKWALMEVEVDTVARTTSKRRTKTAMATTSENVYFCHRRLGRERERDSFSHFFLMVITISSEEESRGKQWRLCRLKKAVVARVVVVDTSRCERRKEEVTFAPDISIDCPACYFSQSKDKNLFIAISQSSDDDDADNYRPTDCLTVCLCGCPVRQSIKL